LKYNIKAIQQNKANRERLWKSRNGCNTNFRQGANDMRRSSTSANVQRRRWRQLWPRWHLTQVIYLKHGKHKYK